RAASLRIARKMPGPRNMVRPPRVRRPRRKCFVPYNLRPSASSIWTKCAANPRISEHAKTVAQDSDAAREGTCAAWVAECVLNGSFATADDMIGMTHPNQWLVTDEMAYFVGEYVAT